MRATAILILIITLVSAVLAYFGAVHFLCPSDEVFYCERISHFGPFYQENIRGHIFAGFLALGGFLLSLKTFIIITMKDHVYDNPIYIEKFEKTKKIKNDIELYDPLKQLSDFLFYSIAASLSASILQMTIGLWGAWWIAIICLVFPVYAVSLLIYSLILIKNNMDSMFDNISPPSTENKEEKNSLSQ